MVEAAQFIVPAVSAVGAFAGAWGAVRADLQNLKTRVERLEKTLDTFLKVQLQDR